MSRSSEGQCHNVDNSETKFLKNKAILVPKVLKNRRHGNERPSSNYIVGSRTSVLLIVAILDFLSK